MNYRHAFHAGNHADVLKHTVLLALCDALTSKPSPCFALDTHAGSGLYALDGESAQRTGEAAHGIARIRPRAHPMIDRYLDAVSACRAVHGDHAYPGSPWLLAHALRGNDRIACCEHQPDEAAALAQVFRRDLRVVVHARDGYAAIPALLPPRASGHAIGRGLVLIDPPYETQLQEFDTALAALHTGLNRWPEGCWLLWFPIKRLRDLQPFRRAAAALPARSILWLQLLLHPADSPSRLNGSGLLLLNAPWSLHDTLPQLPLMLAAQLGGDAESGSESIWLKQPM